MHDRTLPDLVREITRLCLAETDSTIRLMLLRQLALLVNRDLPAHVTTQPKDFVDDKAIASEQLESLISNDSVSSSQIRIAFWIAKALVFRLDSIDEVIPRLVSLLHRPDCGLDCARGFSILLAPDELFTQENGAIIRKLARQRMLSLCIAQISTNIRQANSTTRSNYLIALSGILKYVSDKVMATEIETLLPLLLQSLDLSNANVRATTIESVMLMVRINPALVGEHAVSLITRLLQAASDPAQNANVSRPLPAQPSSLLPIMLHSRCRADRLLSSVYVLTL